MKNYIVLKKPDGSYARCFRILADSYVDRIVRSQEITKTIGGALIVTLGGQHREIEGHILVKNNETETTSDGPFGSYNDLVTLWQSQDPALYPSDARLYLTDLFGNTYRAIMDSTIERSFASVLGEISVIQVRFYLEVT